MHAFRPLTEPPGPNRAILADRRGVPVEVVLDGARLASPRGLWVVVDVGVVVLAGAAAFAAGAAMDLVPAVLAAAAVVLVVSWLVADLLRTGRTPGHRALGARTVDAATGLPPTLGRLSSSRTVDIRHGRDPVHVQPQATEAVPAQGEQWQLTAARALNAPVVLTLDNGMAYSLVAPTVIGRNPARVEDASQLLQVPDLTRTMSKSHALLEPQGGMVWVTDLGSMNGTSVAGDDGEMSPLRPHVRTVVRAGATVEFGDRVATIGTSARAHNHATSGEA